MNAKKLALVTGAGARIGRAIAVRLGERGYDVAVHYRSNAAGAEETAAAVRVLGRRAPVIQADLLSPGAPRALAAAVLKELGGLSLLVNNASIFPTAGELVSNHGLLSETLEEWEAMIAIHARAPFFLIQAFAPALKESGDGSVVNMNDECASEPALSRSAYTISRAALTAVTRLAAGALRPEVRVNALELGPILPPEEMREEVRRTLQWGSVEDVLAAVEYVLKAKNLTGEIIGVRGF